MRRLVEVVEWLFRHLIAYPFLRLLFHNRPSDQQVDVTRVRKILILRFDRIGDMIVTTPIFRILKQRNPLFHIGVFTSPSNAEIIHNNPNLDAIYILHRHWWKLLQEIRRARREHYDVVLNFIFNRTTSAGILANVAGPRAFKVGQGADKYRFYFNRLLQLERTQRHMAEVLASYVEQVFGITLGGEDLRFELFIDEPSRMAVDLFLRKRDLRRKQEGSRDSSGYAVVNISATDPVRTISPEQALGLARHLLQSKRLSVVLIAAPTERRIAETILREVQSEHCDLFPEEGIAPLLQIASLIEGATCVFTPDTSIIHFASAVQTPVLGFFTPLRTTHEWVPFNVHHAAVYAPAGMPVSALGLSEMTRQADFFLSSLQQEPTATS